MIDVIDFGEQLGLYYRDVRFELSAVYGVFVVFVCLLKDSKPEIRLRNSSETTYFSDKRSVFRLGWDTSTSAVGGTPAKPSWSSINARTSLREDSPDFTPGRQVSLPSGAYIPLGLFGAKGSSSIGFQTAMGRTFSSSSSSSSL